jgi:arylsulfatase A-like enzyme
MIRPFLTALLVLPTLAMAAAPTPAAKPRPNVVFFLVDDLGYMDIGANNPRTFYETPHIDALAKRGVRFTDGYAACPVCSPTRAAVLTGKYPQRTGITDYIGAPQPTNPKQPHKLVPAPFTEQLALEETTLAEAFKAGGYATMFAGKWHLGSEAFWPEKQGFDINKGGWDRGGPYGGDKYFSPYGNPRLEDGPKGEHLPDRLATEMAKFIHANRDRPFFAYMSFYDVHTPLMARPDLQKKYEAKAKTLPANLEKFGQERARKVRLVQDHAVYAGMVEAMDQAVGKVLQALQDAGVADNTIVVFTSDNGGLSTSEGWAYEGGVREPLIVAAPGAKAGSVSSAVVTSPDFYPTLLELAGLPLRPEQHRDGVSFVKALRGEKAPARGPVYWHYPHYGNQGGAPYGAVRDGYWKLIEWYEDGSLELFDLAKDPLEENNLAKKDPARVQELLAKLNAWRKDVGALMPTPNPAKK